MIEIRCVAFQAGDRAWRMRVVADRSALKLGYAATYGGAASLTMIICF